MEICGRKISVVSGRLKVQPTEVIQTLLSVDSKYGTVSQAFDADRIAGKNHLLHGVALCLLSEERGERFAKDSRLNLLCWVAAERQIEVAIKKVGVSSTTKNLAIVIMGRDENLITSAVEETRKLLVDRDETVLHVSDEKARRIMKVFSLPPIAEKEIEKFVLEKIALLELAK